MRLKESFPKINFFPLLLAPLGEVTNPYFTGPTNESLLLCAEAMRLCCRHSRQVPISRHSPSNVHLHNTAVCFKPRDPPMPQSDCNARSLSNCLSLSRALAFSLETLFFLDERSSLEVYRLTTLLDFLKGNKVLPSSPADKLMLSCQGQCSYEI